MSAKHTPGPWIVNPMTSGNYIERAAADEAEYTVEIGKVNRWKDAPEEAEANAHLIATAPEMFEALHLVRMSLGWQYLSDESKAVIDAAIAKATGETA